MRELTVFAAVGIAATLTHYCSALAMVELLLVNILVANFFAYCIAVAVSYVGHSKLTFKAEMNKKGASKFLIASLSALLLSQSTLALLSHLQWLDYKINMMITVAVVPCFSYILNKFWVYKKPSVTIE